MYENELIDYLTKYNGFRKDYKNLFPNKEETIRLLLKITLPNDLEPSFFEMEQGFIRNMNSRIQVTDPKSLKYIDGVALFLGNTLFIKADILMDPLFSSLYQPESLMKREFSDDLLFHGGIEIRKDLLEELSKQGHEMSEGEIHLTKGYALPFKEIIHCSFPNELETNEDVESFSEAYLNVLKTFEKQKGKTLVVPLLNNKKEENIFFIKTAKSYLKTMGSKKKIISLQMMKIHITNRCFCFNLICQYSFL